MIQIEIYWDDLTEKAKSGILEVLDVVGVKAKELNWDIFPVTTIDIEEEDEGEEN